MLKRKNLIITRAGGKALYRNWLKGAERNFDLLVVAYNEAGLENTVEGVAYAYEPMPKVRGWRQTFAKRPELLDQYAYIAMIDDDIDTNAVALNFCFDEGLRLDLLMWQPSLTWNSYATFAGLLHNPLCAVRYINGIEMMCPFFHSAYLKRLIPLFAIDCEVGIDLVWCSLTEAPARRFAVLDSIQVQHTRRIGTQMAQNGFANKTYEDDIETCLKAFSMRWPALVSDQAVLTSGRPLKRQAWVTLSALVLLAAPFFAPRGEVLKHVRIVLIHLKHQALRAPYYGDASLIATRLEAMINPVIHPVTNSGHIVPKDLESAV
jgi:hypothetical protein